MRHIGFQLERETIKKPKGPWVLSCNDMYSRYLETQYVGPSNRIEYIINALVIIFMRMGSPITIQAGDEFNTRAFIDFCNAHGIKYFFWKPYENPKNQLIERANLTIKRFMLNYIEKYGWPHSGSHPKNLADDAQQVLDACTWYYNRIWHIFKYFISLLFLILIDLLNLLPLFPCSFSSRRSLTILERNNCLILIKHTILFVRSQQDDKEQQSQ
jgi:hypothetical protein